MKIRRFWTINQFNLLDFMVLILVFLIGLIHLPHPFTTDQGLFITGALEMNRGELLYRDFWDWKQPAIYGFYFLAGKLFGFNEIGIHTFELIYLLIFSIVLIVTLKSYYQHRAIASLVPLLTVGTYYGYSYIPEYFIPHYIQLEALVGFPLFLSLWFAYQASQSSKYSTLWLFLSGLMGSIVLLFKFMFLPILVVFWIATLIYILKQQRKPLKIVLWNFFSFTGLGMILPLFIVFAYFAKFNILDIVYKTFIVYPPMINLETLIGDSSISSRLISGLRWFGNKYSSLVALGLIGASVSWYRQKDLLTLNFILWIIFGFFVIWAQLISLWQHHYLLLSVPLGILAAKGLDVIWNNLKNIEPFSFSRKFYLIAGFSLFFLLTPFLNSFLQTVINLKTENFAFGKEQPLKYQSKIGYKKFLEEISFLSKPESLPGSIYVFGEPLYYYLSGRGQAISINGMYPPTLLPELWGKIVTELKQTRPPYIFVSKRWKLIIAKKSPQFTHFMETNYRVLRKSKAGTWYVVVSHEQHQ